MLVPYAIDEGFLDFSTMDAHVWRNTTPTDYVQNIRKRILKEVRLPVTTGLGNSAKLAKLATDAAKGAGFIEVPAGGEKDFLNDRPVQELSGIAKNRQRSLAVKSQFWNGSSQLARPLKSASIAPLTDFFWLISLAFSAT